MKQYSPWKISVSFKNQSNQVPANPISVSSLNAPFWYIRGLCVNCARSMRENIIVSSNLTRTDRMRSNDKGSSPVMKLREGIYQTERGCSLIKNSNISQMFLNICCKLQVAVQYHYLLWVSLSLPQKAQQNKPAL